MLPSVMFLMPSGCGNDESDVAEPDLEVEASAEPLTSQFARHETSLGCKYPSVMSDAMVRPEGV